MTRSLPAPRGRGRPRLSESDDPVRVVVHVTPESREAWSFAAGLADETLSEWIRGVLDRAARRAGRKAP